MPSDIHPPTATRYSPFHTPRHPHPPITTRTAQASLFRLFLGQTTAVSPAHPISPSPPPHPHHTSFSPPHTRSTIIWSPPPRKSAPSTCSPIAYRSSPSPTRTREPRRTGLRKTRTVSCASSRTIRSPTRTTRGSSVRRRRSTSAVLLSASQTREERRCRRHTDPRRRGAGGLDFSEASEASSKARRRTLIPITSSMV